MTTYKLTIQYDGTRYSGWQKQKNTDNTIQEKMEAIATKLFGVPTDVNGSGRTDAGVHALGQVASMKGNTSRTPEEIRQFFNDLLPMDVRVTLAETAEPRFHARLNATSKHYRYVIDHGPVARVFDRRYVTRMEDDFNLTAMKAAASHLTGTHDFKSFCENKHMKKSTVRTIHRIDITDENGLLVMDFYGDGFLYHMVRILAGTLAETGTGKRSFETIPSIIDAKSRPAAGFTAPAQGLSLVNVRYS